VPPVEFGEKLATFSSTEIIRVYMHIAYLFDIHPLLSQLIENIQNFLPFRNIYIRIMTDKTCNYCRFMQLLRLLTAFFAPTQGCILSGVSDRHSGISDSRPSGTPPFLI